MSWSSISKFVIGLLLAVSIIAGGGLIVARVFIAKLTAPPSKPIYPNDKPATVGASRNSEGTAKSSKAVTTAAKTDKTADSTPPDAPAKPLPPGATQGRVTQSIGLILRDAPNGEQIGGVEYNDRVVVLETSQDGGWQKVRLQSSQKEGWVKAGNVEQVAQ
jgi:hypothetical protein